MVHSEQKPVSKKWNVEISLRFKTGIVWIFENDLPVAANKTVLRSGKAPFPMIMWSRSKPKRTKKALKWKLFCDKSNANCKAQLSSRNGRLVDFRSHMCVSQKEEYQLDLFSFFLCDLPKMQPFSQDKHATKRTKFVYKSQTLLI